MSGINKKEKEQKSEGMASQETFTPQSSTDSNVNQSLGNIELPYEFGRYLIDSLLGEGAMGAVYLAEDTQLQRKIALKTPRFEGEREDLLERFYREARSAAMLSHPNICTVFDVGEHQGTHFISMSYIEGRPLSEFIDPDQLHTEKQIAILIRKLALALSEAHSKSIVHRDLKPANVMIDKKNNPIIMDFGLAVQTDIDVRSTQSGMILGSPAYMSPEQVEGNREKVGKASDIYSLGVIMYELMTGTLPFTGSIGLVMSQILNKKPDNPAKKRPKINQQLESICLKMMAKPIEERFGSMEEVAEILTHFLKSDSTNSSHSTKKEHVRVKNKQEQSAQERLNLLNDATDNQEELATLIQEVDSAIHKNQYDNLLPTINRLLELQPENKKAQQLSEELTTDAESERFNLSDRTTLFTQPAGSPSMMKKVLLLGFPILLFIVGLIFLYTKLSTVDVAFEVEQSLVEDNDVQIKVDGITFNHKGANLKRSLSTGSHLLEIMRAGKVVSTSTFTVNQSDTPLIRVTLNTIVPNIKPDNIKPKTKSVDTQVQKAIDPSRSIWKVSQIFARTPLLDGPPGVIAELKGHTESIIALKFSPDGRTIAASNWNNNPTLRFWDIGTKEEIQKLTNLTTLSAFDFSPKGDKLMSGYHNGGLFLLETSYMKRIHQVNQQNRQNIDAVEISPDGTKGVSCSSDGTIDVWDIKTGKLLSEIRIGKEAGIITYSASFLPDSNQILISSSSGNGTQLYDLITKNVIHTYQNESTGGFLFNHSHQLDISSDGKYFLSVNKQVRLVEIKTGQVMQVFSGFEQAVKNASFLPDGKHILTSGEDSVIRIFNGYDGKKVWELKMQVLSKYSSVSPDGRFVVTSGNAIQDKNQQTHHSGLVVRVVRLPKEFHPPQGDNKERPQLVTAWTVTKKLSSTHLFKKHTAPVRGVRFSKDGTEVFSTSHDNWLLSGNLVTGQHNKVIMPQLKYGLDVSHNGRKIAIHGFSKELFLYDRVARHNFRVTGGRVAISSADFHPNNKHLAVFMTEGLIKILDYSTKDFKTVQSIKIKNTVNRKFSNGNIRYDHSGTQLVFVPQSNSANPTGKCYLFHAETGKKLLDIDLPGKNRSPGSVAASPKTPHFVVGTYQGYASIHQMSDGKELGRLSNHKGGVYALAWSPDGTMIASGDQAGVVRLWNAKTFILMKTMRGHRTVVTDLDFSRDSKMLASCSGRFSSSIKSEEDNTVRVWDTAVKLN